jgi:NADPH:quinone reductase-like Zn-dependent oxidoreductase
MVQRQIEPTISQTLPLSEARAGFEAMLEGQTGGKIVFTV